MSTNDELENKILKWLAKEGYPLEFKAANVFRKHKFETFQGRYVNDYKTNNPREIDVLAQKTSNINDSFLRIQYIVECKWSGEKPWMIFTDENSHISSSACVSQTIAANIADSIIWLLADDKEVKNLNIFKTPHRPGFNGRQAFGGSNDLVYSTLQSVISACYSEKKFYESYIKTKEEVLSFGVLIIPVIVIDGKLFETYFDSASDKNIIKERKQIRLHWKGSEAWSLHSTLDIVTLDSLDNYVELLSKETDVLMEKMLTTFSLIDNCLKEKSIEPIKHLLGGARGVISLPPILNELVKEMKKGT